MNLGREVLCAIAGGAHGVALKLSGWVGQSRPAILCFEASGAGSHRRSTHLSGRWVLECQVFVTSSVRHDMPFLARVQGGRARLQAQQEKHIAAFVKESACLSLSVRERVTLAALKNLAAFKRPSPTGGAMRQKSFAPPKGAAAEKGAGPF